MSRSFDSASSCTQSDGGGPTLLDDDDDELSVGCDEEDEDA